MSRADRIEKNYNTFRKICTKLDRREAVFKLLDALEEQIALSPASTRASYHNCFPGGLIEYSFRTLKNARQLNEMFGFNCTEDSVTLVCLFHAIGKVGDLSGPLYESEESDWHREKLGKLFRISETIQKMSIADRSLFLLQNFDVKLSQDEWIAIKLSDGRYHKEEGSYYDVSAPDLATLLEMAVCISVKQCQT